MACIKSALFLLEAPCPFLSAGETDFLLIFLNSNFKRQVPSRYRDLKKYDKSANITVIFYLQQQNHERIVHGVHLQKRVLLFFHIVHTLYQYQILLQKSQLLENQFPMLLQQEMQRHDAFGLLLSVAHVQDLPEHQADKECYTIHGNDEATENNRNYFFNTSRQSINK